jgi:hypothetical protein
MLEQVPSLPATAQLLQVPGQVLLQQTPSTQLPLAHSKAFLHVAPSSSLAVQAVPEQKAALSLQSPLLAQEVKHFCPAASHL